MKKFSALLITTIFSALLLLCVSVNFTAPLQVKALPLNVSSSNAQTVFGLDETLFSALLALKNAIRSEGAPSTDNFPSSFFAVEYASCSPTEEEGENILEDLGNGTLNLTLGENSPYDCLKGFTDDKIASISGLNNLNLSTIKILILDDNEISRISSGDLEGLSSIDELSVCNNKLSSFTINPSLSERIIRLKLRNNLLKNINISTVGLNSEVDLAANLFENVGDITIGNNKPTSLDLSFNNITEDLASFSTLLGYSPVLLVQGLNKSSFTAGEKIAIINDSNYAVNLVGHVKYDSESTYHQDNSDITHSASTQGINLLTLPAGKIEVSFTYDSLPNLSENIGFLADKLIFSKLPAPKVSATSNGREITSFSQHFPMSFSFSMNDEIDFVGLNEARDDAVLFCGIKGEEEEEASSFRVGEFMTVTLSAYYVFDGIIGEKLAFDVSYTKESNITLGIIIIILLFVVLASIVYIVRWIREGAPIAPLTPAEIAREKRRFERKSGSGDFPFLDDTQGGSDAQFSQQDTGENDDTVDLLSDRDNKNNNSKTEEGRYKK